MTGIAIKCFVMISTVTGAWDWVHGRETYEYNSKLGKEMIYFSPNDGGPMRKVNSNDCQYTEDPVFAKIRELDARKIDRIKVGRKAWCLVDEWGRQQCTFDTMEQCMKRMDNLSYCEPNEEYK